jgi:hypothetical protein
MKSRKPSRIQATQRQALPGCLGKIVTFEAISDQARQNALDLS